MSIYFLYWHGICLTKSGGERSGRHPFSKDKGVRLRKLDTNFAATSRERSAPLPSISLSRLIRPRACFEISVDSWGDWRYNPIGGYGGAPGGADALPHAGD
jgi:hypothetical protein